MLTVLVGASWTAMHGIRSSQAGAPGLTSHAGAPSIAINSLLTPADRFAILCRAGGQGQEGVLHPPCVPVRRQDGRQARGGQEEGRGCRAGEKEGFRLKGAHHICFTYINVPRADEPQPLVSFLLCSLVSFLLCYVIGIAEVLSAHYTSTASHERGEVVPATCTAGDTPW